MKKIVLFGALLATTFVATNAQTQSTSCGTNYRIAMDDPAFAADQAKFNQYLQQYAQDPDAKAGGYRIMPVVVHIIHNGGSANVSNADVYTMIAKMNQAYSRTPTNINTLPLRFDTLAGEAMIEFRLATRDPLGNCTDGIRRVYAPHKSSDTYDDKDFKALSYWDRSKYLNIWVVNNIAQPNPNQLGTTLAYAIYPGAAPALSDGVAIARGPMTTQAVASHEVGHHLNLIHIWGDAVCGNDEVDDTPIARSENFALSNPCDTLINEADCYENVVDNYRDSLLRFAIGENYQNYMDYVNNYNCPNMFTHGQIERMNATLEFYSFRKSVVSPENNMATGTQDNAPACDAKAPVAEFWAPNRVVCAGTAAIFTDGSFNGAPTSWFWEFEGGTPATSTDQNPSIVYNTPGTYGVTLTVTNANGSHTKTKQNVVFVLNTEVESKAWGYTEGFEGDGNYQAGRWTVVNDQTDAGKQWNLSAPQVAYTGSFSIKMNNFNNVRDNNSSLISPAVNMDAIDGGNKVIRFKAAYAFRTNEPTLVLEDKLTLSRSADCGENWTTVKTFSGSELLSAGLSPASFSPEDLTMWKTITVNLAGANAIGSNVRYRFHFNSGGPFNNNLFIDDIQIIATSGPNASIDELAEEMFDLNVYPNPLAENSTLAFNLPQSVGKANIGVYDITGRFVSKVYTGELSAGQQYFNISRESLGASGVYFVKLELDGKILTRKIIVK